jgi:N-acyl-D-amino-acid deacylase
MCGILSEQLTAGSPGLSSGLLYVPGIFADAGELNALMRTLAKYDKVYTTHLRSEGNKLLESLEETLYLAEEAGLKKVLISHLKTAGMDNFHKLD